MRSAGAFLEDLGFAMAPVFLVVMVLGTLAEAGHREPVCSSARATTHVSADGTRPKGWGTPSGLGAKEPPRGAARDLYGSGDPGGSS